MVASLKAFIATVNADPACTWAWIHYAGHGAYRRDKSDDGDDETDGTLLLQWRPRRRRICEAARAV
jgi:hypothetical protein